MQESSLLAYRATVNRAGAKDVVVDDVSVELRAAINRFLAETNNEPKPFTWTADSDKIIAAVKRGHQVLGSLL
jgi:hypothetical protein